MTEVPPHWIKALEEVAGRLDQFVVSLDHIGNLSEDLDELVEPTSDFITRWDIFRSMARSRMLIHELLEETVDRDRLGEDEHWLDGLQIPEYPYWPDGP